MNIQLRRAIIALSLLAICLFLLGVAFYIDRLDSIPDFFGLWAAGKLVAQGSSPYDLTMWSEIVNSIGWLFVYPMPTAIIFVPFGIIPFNYSFFLWTFISAILAVASVLILISLEGKQKAKYYLFPVFAGLIAFRPMLVALRNGQIANLLLFLIVLAILFTSHNKRFFAGFLFVGLLYKHSLGIPIFGGIGLLLIFRKDWKSIAGMILGVIVWAGTAIVVDPGWINRFLHVGNQVLNVTLGYAPTIWGLAGLTCGRIQSCTGWVGGGAALAFGLFFVFLLWKSRANFMTGLCICILIPFILSPYAWAYDQVLLIVPIIYLVGEGIRRNWPFMVTSLIFLTFSLISLVLLMIAVGFGHDEFSVFLPVILLTILTLMIFFPKDGNEIEEGIKTSPAI